MRKKDGQKSTHYVFLGLGRYKDMRYQFRIRFLVYPRVQLALLAVHTVVYATFLAMLELQHRSSIAAMLGNAQFDFVELKLQNTWYFWAIASLFVYTAGAILLIAISHKMAGPILRTRDHLEKIAISGDYEPILFREKDYFSELPASINRAFEAQKNSTKRKIEVA